MPSTYTSRFRFTLEAPGENLNTWGTILNTGAITLIDDAIGGYLSKAVSGNVTLTSANGSTDESRLAILDFTSGTGGNVTIPAVSKVYQTRNNTSGNVVITTGSGVSATVESGSLATVIVDGTNVRRMTDAADLSTTLSTAKAYTDAAAFASSSGVLPGQPGNGGKFLTTDGSTASWGAIPGLTNISTSLTNVSSSLASVSTSTAGVSSSLSTTNLTVGAVSSSLSSTNSNVTKISSSVSSTASTVATYGNVVTQNTGTSGANVPLLNGNNVWSAAQQIVAAAPQLIVNTSTVQNRNMQFWTNGLPRWGVQTDNASESGANAGSNFQIFRSSDAGSFIDSPISISRATGLVTIADGLIFTPAAVPTASHVGYLGIPQTTKSGNYGPGQADLGTEIFFTASATATLPANASVPIVIGSFLVITADAGQTVTLAITTDTLRWPGGGNVTGSRTITGPGFAVVSKKKSTEWWVTGGSGIS